MGVVCYLQKVVLLVVQPCARLTPLGDVVTIIVIVGGGGFVVVSDGASVDQGIRDHVIGLQKNCTNRESNCESQPLQKGQSPA